MDITITITETIEYQQTYTREELIYRFPFLATVPENELAAYIQKNQPPDIESHLNDYFGEVLGHEWKVQTK